MLDMSILSAAEAPAGRPARRWALDALITAVAGVCAVPPAVHHGSPLHFWVILIFAIQVLPLLLRRVWPVQVFAWILLVTLVSGLRDSNLVDGAPLLISLYTIAATLPRKYGLWAAALLELAMIVTSISVAGSAWWYDAIFLSGLVAAALGLGLYTATRRAYLVELHDRTERAERERDQQVALAAAAERTRIAREMHDIVAHHLTMMVALSDGAVAASASSPARAADVMRTVSATGRRALNDTRRLLGILRQPPGSGSGKDLRPLPDLSELDALIDQVRAAGLPTTLERQGVTSHLPPGIQLTAFRLIQEALTNTLKHGGDNAQAIVRLRCLPDELLVDIEDDGAGASAPTPLGVGSGLVGMRERVHAYGGQVEAAPLHHRGWKVSARLHLGAEGDS